MAAVAKNPAFAKKVGIKPSVGEEFLTADKGKKFKEGGDMKKMNPGMMAMMAKKKLAKKMAEGGMPMVEKDGKKVPAFAADGKGKMAKGGMATKMAKGGGIESKGKTKGKMITMKKGGKAC